MIINTLIYFILVPAGQIVRGGETAPEGYVSRYLQYNDSKGQTNSEHQQFRGRIIAFQAVDPGSIPG